VIVSGGTVALRFLFSELHAAPKIVGCKFSMENMMKRLLVVVAVVGTALSSAAEAKGCIKGAIVGGVAGHMAGHGKLGAAAGCAVGHHEANKADAEKAKGQSTNPPPKDGGKM
jgi:hypothetical protein